MQLQPDEIVRLTQRVTGQRQYIGVGSNEELLNDIVEDAITRVALALHRRELIETPCKKSNNSQYMNGLRNQVSPDARQKIAAAVTEIFDALLLDQDIERSEAKAIQTITSIANTELANQAERKRSEGRA